MDVLHDEEDLLVGDDRIERRDDVRMLDARGKARLVDEHLDELALTEEVRMDSFDCDGAREPHRRRR